MNNLPKVVTQQRRGRASNPRLIDHKSDTLPLSHRATPRGVGRNALSSVEERASGIKIWCKSRLTHALIYVAAVGLLVVIQ